MSIPTKVARRGFVAGLLSAALATLFWRRAGKAGPSRADETGPGHAASPRAREHKLPTWIGHY